MRSYDKEVETIVELSNRSLRDNWGYAPLTEAEAEAMARDLKPVVQPRGVLIAEDASGRPVGFGIAIPDINQLLPGLNGRLLPFGWLKLLYGIPRLRRYRMFALGVIPEYHGRGVDSLIYRKLYEYAVRTRCLDGDQLRVGRQRADEQRHPQIKRIFASPLPHLSNGTLTA